MSSKEALAVFYEVVEALDGVCQTENVGSYDGLIQRARKALAVLTPTPGGWVHWERPDYGSHTCVSGIMRPYEGNLCAHPACWSSTPTPEPEGKPDRYEINRAYLAWGETLRLPIKRPTAFEAFDAGYKAAALARARRT